MLVDTTCGSVLNVWKRVESYARDGYTALIHGKHYHEETQATASQVMKYPGGHYLVVRNMDEARHRLRLHRAGGDAAALAARFAKAVSPGFDFARDLERVGVANQTTMLAGESLAIADESAAASSGATAPRRVADHFRSFDTICSATQERQDAVLRAAPGAARRDGRDRRLQLEQHLPPRGAGAARGASAPTTSRTPTAWIPAAGTIRHQPIGTKHEVTTADWLGDARVIGITAGASTPNNKVGETIARICALAGVGEELRAQTA